MLRYLLDTNSCIQVLYERPRGLQAQFNDKAEALCLSDVVLYELLHGAERSGNPPRVRREVKHFTRRRTVLPFDSDAAAHTADIRADLEQRGRTIGPCDLMIAEHARSRAMVVVTDDLDEF